MHLRLRDRVAELAKRFLMALEKQWALMAMAGGSARCKVPGERGSGVWGRNECGATARAQARLKGSEARGERGRVGAGRAASADGFFTAVMGARERLEGGDGSDRWVPYGGEREEERRGLSAGP